MDITHANIIVIKVGTSTLTYPNGKLNLRGMASLCKTISDLQNSGKKIILVSSGAIGVGMGKLDLKERPHDNAKKQALAAIGQCELMFMYDKLFGEYDRKVAQVLLTKDDTSNSIRRHNASNTFSELLQLDIIPIVNENDTVATDELEGVKIGDNDTLSAIVAELVGADALIILTDIDGMYDGNPKNNPNAMRIPYIREITPEIEALAGGSGTSLGTGGMATKVSAAKIATGAGVVTAIISSDKSDNLYDLLEGKDIGTIFAVPWKCPKQNGE